MMSHLQKTALLALLLSIFTLPAYSQDNPFTLEKMLADADVLPAVNSCLRIHPRGNTVFIQSITPMNHGMVNIVTADTGSRQMECIAELRTGKVSSLTPMIDSKGPLFVSIIRQKREPRGECFSTQPIKQGKLLIGW